MNSSSTGTSSPKSPYINQLTLGEGWGYGDPLGVCVTYQ